MRMRVVFWGLIAGVVAFGQQEKPQLTNSLSGPEIFKTSCASCHGIDGKGAGPAASALKKAPSDLTQLAKKNGGRFPTEQVRNYIDGRNPVGAHGSREMPVWGEAFQEISSSPASVTYRIVTLSAYIESLQAK